MINNEHGGDIFAYENIRYDFSVNINPLGMPEEVKRAVCEHIAEYETYPDTKYRALLTAISGMESVPAGSIICGNGAADLIYRLCLSLKPKNALVCAPGFAEYERAALLSGAEVKHHCLREENGFTLTGSIIEDITGDVDIVFLCTPNNPTGRLTDNELIEKVVRKAAEQGCIVVLDECFIDFTSGRSSKYLMDKYDNLVILKAFTKIYSMAGLRLGYMLCSDTRLLKNTDSFGQCWSVSSPAQYAGIAACSVKGFVEKTRELIAEERPFLIDGIRELGIKAYDSDANFILFRSEAPLKERLIDMGILIRACGNFRGLDSRYYRVAVKTRQANRVLLDALRECAAEQ